MPDTERETKRVEFTRSTDVIIKAQPAEYGQQPELDSFLQEPTEDWADIVLRPSGGEMRRYINLVERVRGTGSRYEVGAGLISMFTVDWSLTDASGVKLPFDQKGQDVADGDYLRQLAEAIWTIVGPRIPKI